MAAAAFLPLFSFAFLLPSSPLALSHISPSPSHSPNRSPLPALIRAPSPSFTSLPPSPSPSPIAALSPPSSSPRHRRISPSPSQATSASPSPAPSPANELLRSADDFSGAGEDASGKGGKKAGIAVGVVAAATLVGLGGRVYKKRRDNIRRERYGYSDRIMMEMI